jgi:hypothetical protein
MHMCVAVWVGVRLPGRYMYIKNYICILYIFYLTDGYHLLRNEAYAVSYEKLHRDE